MWEISSLCFPDLQEFDYNHFVKESVGIVHYDFFPF